MTTEYGYEMLSRLRASHPRWMIRLIQGDWIGELRFDDGHIVLGSRSPETLSRRMAELEQLLIS